jgi:hypothetical protein
LNRITHWIELAAGGHVAAMETPELLISDSRALFRTVG